MTYDLMNRRDNVTLHHTSVAGSAKVVEDYLALGAPASKINLGFAFYAKYFATAGDCTASGALNCPIEVAEDPITGADTGTSGAMTFEKANMQALNASALPFSVDGTCGADLGTRCSTGCCSQFGHCGTTEAHCGASCQHAFGTGCTGVDVAGSWQLALQNGATDEEAGGQYFFDAANKLFWTWDTKELMARKFDDIVAKYNLGGVMSWSLGEDSNDWSHIATMAQGLERLNGKGGNATAPYTVGKPPPATNKLPVMAATTIKSKPAPKAILSPKVAKSKYNVVYVDGVGGPDAEESGVPHAATVKKPEHVAEKPAVVPVAGPKAAEKVNGANQAEPWQDKRRKRMRVERA